MNKSKSAEATFIVTVAIFGAAVGFLFLSLTLQQQKMAHAQSMASMFCSAVRTGVAQGPESGMYNSLGSNAQQQGTQEQQLVQAFPVYHNLFVIPQIQITA